MTAPMPDAGSPPDDAFAVAAARAELEAVNDRRAATPVRGPGERSKIEAARLIAYFLTETERKLGMSERVCRDWDEYARGLVVAAQGGKLDHGWYRCLWEISRGLGQASRQPGTETVAPPAS